MLHEKMDNKKAHRKINRFASRLKKSNIKICSSPSTNIVICNAGQATGLQKYTIQNLISSMLPDIPVPKYIAEKGESYSFLVFDRASYAEAFVNKCSGKTKVTEDMSPLYMTFVESVPVHETVCIDDDPKGLSILFDFITDEEEETLLDEFNFTDSNLKNRQVKHYGYEFQYGSNDVDLTSPLSEPIPKTCEFIWERLKALGVDIDNEPDQLTVNKYLPGQGIPSHVDKHSPFKSTILSLSLGSSVVMDWKRHDGINIPVYVPSKSMLVMTDEARYNWQHGIQPRTWDPVIEIRTNVDDETQFTKVVTHETVDRGVRISLTYRWTRTGPCQCLYKTLCDSTVKTPADDLEEHLASNLEELHVHQVYEKIAGHFSTTRHKPWPKVVEFMSQVQTGAIVFDLGSGNGKNIIQRNDILQVAGERSASLLSECKRYTRDMPCTDCVRLDLLNGTVRDACADVAICIAVIHHFSTKARRLQAVTTIARLLSPGGRVLITVWAKDQTESNYLAKNKRGLQTAAEDKRVLVGAGIELPVHENRTQFQHSDLLVPWKLRAVQRDLRLADAPESTLLRYYHVFREGELDDLCATVPDLIVESSFYEEGNWCVICKKI